MTIQVALTAFSLVVVTGCSSAWLRTVIIPKDANRDVALVDVRECTPGPVHGVVVPWLGLMPAGVGLVTHHRVQFVECMQKRGYRAEILEGQDNAANWVQVER